MGDDRMNDHARGCQGREYTCTCGYDNERDAELQRLRAEVERLTDDLKRANELINAAIDDYNDALADGKRREAEAMERAAQIAYEKADEHLRIWEDDNILPEVAVEHKACADALHDLAEAIRQDAIRAEASKKGGAT